VSDLRKTVDQTAIRELASGSEMTEAGARLFSPQRSF